VRILDWDSRHSSDRAARSQGTLRSKHEKAIECPCGMRYDKRVVRPVPSPSGICLQASLMRNLNLVFCGMAFLAAGALAQSLPTATLTTSNAVFAGQLGHSMAISGSTVAAAGPDGVDVFIKPSTALWTDMTESAHLLAGAASIAINGGCERDCRRLTWNRTIWGTLRVRAARWRVARYD